MVFYMVLPFVPIRYIYNYNAKHCKFRRNLYIKGVEQAIDYHTFP
nr:MAG TPA: hypothetical protein [Caudoviricetes sp.]